MSSSVPLNDAPIRGAPDPLSRTALGDGYPLSPLQHGMLFHWLVDPHSGTNVEQVVADLDERIDPSRLERAWQDTVDKFSTLRTTFAWEGLSTPLQHIEARAPLHLALEDLRSLPPDEHTRRLEEFLAADRQEGFDLTRAPLMRVTLFQLADARFQMVWSFHHILIDRRAFELILNDVFDGYGGRPRSDLPDRPYREYIAWTTQQDQEDALAFWRDKLQDFAAPTPLWADHPRASDAARYGHAGTRLSLDATQRLRELAARERLSLNILVMGAWTLLLSRYTRERDIVFGATKTTRRGTIANADSMVGLFLATIPVRIAVDENLSVTNWLRRVREEWVSIRGSEHVPLVDIRGASAVPSAAPLFETLVVFENYEYGRRLNARGGEWSARRFRTIEQTGYPLTLLSYGDPSLVIDLEFDALQFERSTIDRMLGHLTSVLEAWGRDTSVPLWQTPMLTQAELAQTLHDWNQTTRPYPHDVPVSALVERQVERTPDATAAIFHSESITYRELNERANRLARELVRYGAAAETTIGLAVERSIDMLVAVLAVAKTGAAYVPLDPMFPPDRLTYMAEDSGLRLLITQTSVRGLLPTFDGVVFNLDAPTWRENDSANLDVAMDPENLAVLIYTSGSTGKPKGVQVTRRALVNVLCAVRDLYNLGPNDCLLGVTTISFDIAGADIWLPWIVGARVVLANPAAASDGDQLRALIDRHDVTLLQATPITWRLLLDAGWEGKQNLQAVCTGEAMPPEVSEGLVPRVGRLWNLYGPTETTIWSTGLVVNTPSERNSIGRPLANTQCYVLDEHLQPVPVRVTGELFIGGDGVARGYRNRSELTAERFMADPFRNVPGARMYRTGDLARFLDDGTIECFGRTDYQVKIRGYRIELGEIENVMRMHPSVRQAVVVAREHAPGDRRLIAYVVTQDVPLDATALRVHLMQSLPDYMVPPSMVQLDRIPLTANGKIDRRALPTPDRTQLEEVAVTARTHVEKQLSEIWEEIFEVPEISVLQNFFDLGGHSILAVKMMARIANVFGKQLPLNALFESPTIEQLAQHITDADRTIGRHTVVSIRASGSRPPIFWIPGGAALGLFWLRTVVTSLGPDQPVYGLGSEHPESLEDVETVEERARKYLELVRRVQPHGPYCFSGFCAGGYVAYEMAQQVTSAGEDVAFVGIINCEVPRFPSSVTGRLLVRAQRLRHQVGEARKEGHGLVGYVSRKLAARRQARAHERELAAAAEQVKASGFQRDADAHNRVLLKRTAEVFDRYVPRPYPGSISLFISDEEAYLGVSAELDARRQWVHFAAQYEIRMFPGGHDSVLDRNDAGAFAATLKVALEDALRSYAAKRDVG